MLLLLDKNFYPLMKIILVHSRWSKDKKMPWLYFGSSYLKMKNWEKKFSGTKINIQKEYKPLLFCIKLFNRLLFRGERFILFSRFKINAWINDGIHKISYDSHN